MALHARIGMHVVKEDEREHMQDCPDAEYNICDPELTVFPRSSYRCAGGEDVISFGKFWKRYMPMISDELYGDHFYALKPLIDHINSLPDKCGNALDTDRMKWFKFWSNKAVELYGENAYIQFG